MTHQQWCQTFISAVMVLVWPSIFLIFLVFPLPCSEPQSLLRLDWFTIWSWSFPRIRCHHTSQRAIRNWRVYDQAGVTSSDHTIFNQHDYDHLSSFPHRRSCGAISDLKAAILKFANTDDDDDAAPGGVELGEKDMITNVRILPTVSMGKGFSTIPIAVRSSSRVRITAVIQTQ